MATTFMDIGHAKVILLIGTIINIGLFYEGFLVNGTAVTPIEANSSSSHITAKHGSTVYLHWAYTYVGDGRHTLGAITFLQQEIGFNSTSHKELQVLAKRSGERGPLQLASPLPASFEGRVDVIPSNSTLVIRDLQFNDSMHEYSSNIQVNMQFTATARQKLVYQLEPKVKITVTGAPKIVAPPKSELDVTENSNFELKVEMTGYPQPSAVFQWSHLSGSSSKTVPSVELYPGIYSSNYLLENIGASYCGRIIQTSAKNNLGLSSAVMTNVTVLMKFDKDLGIKAGKKKEEGCIEVKWTRLESGACYVKYEVKFKNELGTFAYTEVGYNVNEMEKCKIPSNMNITEIQLTVSFKSESKSFTVPVSEGPIVVSTAAPQTKEPTLMSTKQNGLSSSSTWGKTVDLPKSTSGFINITKEPPEPGPNIGMIVGATFGGVIFLIIVIVLVIYLHKRKQGSKRDVDSCQPENPLHEAPENQYAAVRNPRKPPQATYTDDNKVTLVYGKLGNRGEGERSPHSKKDDTSDYADVKVDEFGYPAVGAMPASYADGYGEKSRSRGDSGRDSSRRVVPDRKPPQHYNSPADDYGDEYRGASNQRPGYAQVNKPRKHR